MHVPPGTRLCTADAVSMYTNINTEQTLHLIGAYLCCNKDKFSNTPIPALMSALKIVMTNNVF